MARETYTFTHLPQEYKHSPTICHRIVAKHRDDFTKDSSILLTHYIDDVLIQRENKKQIQICLEKLLDHLQQRGWKINPGKIQGPSQTVKFLGIV